MHFYINLPDFFKAVEGASVNVYKFHHHSNNAVEGVTSNKLFFLFGMTRFIMMNEGL